MKAFSSLQVVVALWLGVSFALWMIYRLFRRRDGSKQKRLALQATALVEEGVAFFGGLRVRSSAKGYASYAYGWGVSDVRSPIQDDVHALLNGIEMQSSYFDRVKTAKKSIEKAFGLTDFAPLAEILQIRRDFWAASEIVLIEDIRALGAELAELDAYETFRAEALALLFRDEAAGRREADPVSVRLSIARDEAADFCAKVEDAITAEFEKGRAPTPAEILVVPVQILRSAASLVRESRTIFSDAASTAHSFARVVGVKGLNAAAMELRKARTDLPGQFASAFERAGGLARKGGDRLKRHYEFLLEAQEVRARYAELLSRAPILTEKGKQFLARLELEKHAEQVRETSSDASDWLRQKVVIAIAHLIRSLQVVQARITPQQNKQLAIIASAAEPVRPAAADMYEEPLRVALLPSASYTEGRRARGGARGKRTVRKQDEAETDFRPSHLSGTTSGRLRDLVTGDATVAEFDRAKPARAASFRRSDSLIERLSTVEHEDKEALEDFPPTQETDPARRSIRPLKSVQR